METEKRIKSYIKCMYSLDEEKIECALGNREIWVFTGLNQGIGFLVPPPSLHFLTPIPIVSVGQDRPRG